MRNEQVLEAIEKQIGSQLKEKRLKRGFTLTFVASKIGLSYQQVQKYEQAKCPIPASVLYELADIYGVSVEKFFDNIEVDKIIDTDTTKYIIYANYPKENINILLAEDNPGDEIIIRKALEDFDNINTLCVHDGVQVIEVVRYKTLCADFPKPDLIFLDLSLPKKDGLSVLRDIKRDRNIQEIPVIILTNNISTEIMINAYKLGASGYICKSFDYDTFKDNISSCITYWSKAVILPSITE
ncbi:MAG: response regulator [Holosporales bacterium]|jgi:CheY-like chemotaxis protein|nr:response regulator [Holosporales bacterium]